MLLSIVWPLVKEGRKMLGNPSLRFHKYTKMLLCHSKIQQNKTALKFLDRIVTLSENLQIVRKFTTAGSDNNAYVWS